MKEKLFAGMVGLGSIALIGCAGSPGPAADGGGPVSEAGEVREGGPAIDASAIEQRLLGALHAERQRAGKRALAISSKLAAVARAESQQAAASGQLPGDNAVQLVGRTGFGSIGKLHGTLKDRGPRTGASFVEYWSKGQADTVLDDWSSVGVGVSRGADGRLFAIVVFGGVSGIGGGSLMEPAMSPSGRPLR